MTKTVKIYSMGEIRSGVSTRTGDPWASREVVLQILDPSHDLQETLEKVVVNMKASSKERLEEVKLEDKYIVRLRFHASLYDKTKRWYNNISVDLSEAKFLKH